jgi:DNA-binding beta-propeller fold protein YncE
MSATLYAFSAYAALLFTTVLGWGLSPWATAAILLTTAAAVATAWVGGRGMRVPPVLPLGLLIILVLSGWWREGSRVRCDDYLHARGQSDVEILVPSRRELAGCTAGTTVPLHRYPRQIWEAPDGQTLVFTTQFEPFAEATTDGLEGALCVANPRDGAEPSCSGEGKGDGIVEMARHDRLLAVSSGGPDNGRLYTVPLDRLRSEPELVRVHRAGSAIYDASLDVLYVIGDDGRMIIPMRGDDLEPSADVPVQLPMLADYGRYDDARHQGILCGAAGPIGALANGGRPYLIVGFEGQPLALRPVEDSLVGWLAFSFGCDWDPATRRAYVALPNLGAVAELDYDTGRLIDLDPAPIGLRYLRFDPHRHRLYAGDFLRGNVVELDAGDKHELRRWFVGRFARDVRPTRDGTALLAASNLGVVRIRL